MFDKCLLLFVFALPIIWLPGFTQNNLQMLFFNYGTLILFGLSILSPAKRECRNYNILLLLAMSIAISLFRNPHTLSISLLNIFFGCLLYFIIVRSLVDVKRILKVFVWLALVNIIAAVLQIAGVDFLYKTDTAFGKYVCGFMAHKNHLAMFLALASPILLQFSWMWLIPVFILLLYLKCLSALLGFIVGLAVWISFKKIALQYKVIIFSLMVLTLIISSVNLPAYKLASRLPVWNVMLKESFLNPFLGKGLDSFKALAEAISTKSVEVIISYSEYVRLAFEFGILPLIAIALSLFRYYKKIFIADNLLAQALLSSVVSFLIMMGFQDPLHITRLAIPFLVVLACLEVVCIDNKKEAVC